MVQVDLRKPVSRCEIGPAVLKEIEEAVHICASLGRIVEPDILTGFRTSFETRFGQGFVPLSQALDEEYGIGVAGTPIADGTSLLKGLRIGASTSRQNQRTASSSFAEKLVNGRGERLEEVELSPDDLGGVDQSGKNLPYAFSVFATLIAKSDDALRSGDFEVLFKGGKGAPAMRAFGRFCEGNSDLEERVRYAVERESAQYPDAVFAELVHYPGGRIGNVLVRPALFPFEIPYLGRSALDLEHQIDIEDLLVGIVRGEIVLWSRRLNKRVLPRTTNAHGYANVQLPPIYRFLCSLQEQGIPDVPYFQWGSLSSLSYLPRVRCGRVILSLARWCLSAGELGELKDRGRYELFCKVQEIREKRGLPRFVSLAEGDNYLPLDLDNALSVDAFAHSARRLSSAVLFERYPRPDQLIVLGPDGKYEHEMVVPFLRSEVSTNAMSSTISTDIYNRAAVATSSELRRFVPGSEWQYLKLYTGWSFGDALITKELPRFLTKLRNRCPDYKWFFLRYADPDYHIRLRVTAPIEAVSEAVKEAFSEPLRCGLIWKLQFDTYEREIERYGGPSAIEEVESIFNADSDTVVEVLRVLRNSERSFDERWRVCVLSVEQFISDCRLEIDEAFEVVNGLRSQFAEEFKIDKETRLQVDERYRRERPILDALRAQFVSDADPIGQLLLRRSEAVRRPIEMLRDLSQRDQLTVELPRVYASLVHMNINRIMHTQPRVFEYFIYDFVRRRLQELRKQSEKMSVAISDSM